VEQVKLLVFYNSHTHSIMVVCFVNWLLMLVYVFCMMALFKEFLSNFERNSCSCIHGRKVPFSATTKAVYVHYPPLWMALHSSLCSLCVCQL